MRRVGGIIVVVLLFLGCKEDPQPTGSIAGVVSENGTAEAIVNASVSLGALGLDTQTTSDGSFEITGVKAGTYNVEVEKDGYQSLKKAVSVLPGQTTTTTFELSRDMPLVSISEITFSNNKTEESFTISNPGNGTMQFSSSTSQTWLTTTPANGSIGPLADENITVSADFSGLSYGEYNETVSFDFSGIVIDIPVAVHYVEPANITWVNWYLSVPIDNGSGGATSIFYNDIISNNLTSDEQAYFHLDETDGSYVMFTHFTGYTTSGYYELNSGAYCRTELREFWQGNQSTSDNWLFDDNYHKMESTIKVDYCEGVGETFVAQIHGKSSVTGAPDGSPATVKVKWANGMLRLNYYVKPPDDNWTSANSDSENMGSVGNEKFTVTLLVDAGVLYYALSCPANNIDTGLVQVYDYKSNGYHYDNYFKTGNYFKFNGDYNQSSQVRLYKVVTDHH